MTNIKTEVEAESTEAAQLAQHALEAAITAIREWQDDLGLCEAPFRVTLHVDNGNEADREVSAPLDETVEISQRTGQYDDGWIRHDGGECPVQAMDVVGIAFPDGYIETGVIASRIRWHWGNRGAASHSDVVDYHPLRDPDGIPYCSAEGLEDWAEYVATDGEGRSAWQYESMPQVFPYCNRWGIIHGTRSACIAPNAFANTHDHWTQTLRRVWRPEV